YQRQQQRQELDDSPHPRLSPSGPFAARMFAPASLPAQSSVRWDDEQRQDQELDPGLRRDDKPKKD
ncbi:MAG TPA: hypothetical protein VM555_08735, partial [Tahibacter sp.]|nr:hypothetical protein [Tahibacter sp.]